MWIKFVLFPRILCDEMFGRIWSQLIWSLREEMAVSVSRGKLLFTRNMHVCLSLRVSGNLSDQSMLNLPWSLSDLPIRQPVLPLPKQLHSHLRSLLPKQLPCQSGTPQQSMRRLVSGRHSNHQPSLSTPMPSQFLFLDELLLLLVPKWCQHCVFLPTRYHLMITLW